MNDVICLAVGKTYEIVLETKVTAHPNSAPYPSAEYDYVIPIKKGGSLEYMYDIKKKISCMPNDIYLQEKILSEDEYAALVKYHEKRKDSFGYGKLETQYVFYILGEPLAIKQPFEKKGIQVSVKMNSNDIPLENTEGKESCLDILISSMYLGITNTSWVNFIKEQKDNLGTYINFWTPELKVFKSIKPGELFLFKLHAKKSKGENGEIVGGAYFVGFEQMSVSDAWEKFNIGNGTESYSDLEFLIRNTRVRNNIDIESNIGCIVLRDPFFFNKEKWIESPIDWGKNIVSGKKYDISFGIGLELYKKVTDMIKENSNDTIIKCIESEIDKLLGVEREAYIKVRVNQGVFRDRLLAKYNHCCLCKVSNPKFLVASHIKPWAVSEPSEKLDTHNGLLMCPNHDALFDSGYISFDDTGKIMISDHLDQIDATHMNVNRNTKIELSDKSKIYLKYHNNNIFKK